MISNDGHDDGCLCTSCARETRTLLTQAREALKFHERTQFDYLMGLQDLQFVGILPKDAINELSVASMPAVADAVIKHVNNAVRTEHEVTILEMDAKIAAEVMRRTDGLQERLKAAEARHVAFQAAEERFTQSEFKWQRQLHRSVMLIREMSARVGPEAMRVVNQQISELKAELELTRKRLSCGDMFTKDDISKRAAEMNAKAATLPTKNIKAW